MVALLTPREAAARLRVSVDTVDRERRRGHLGALKVGRQWRYTEPDLAEYLDRCRAPAAPKACGSPSAAASGTFAATTPPLDGATAVRLAVEAAARLRSNLRAESSARRRRGQLKRIS
jgi:excisionase family DNA binding protein